MDTITEYAAICENAVERLFWLNFEDDLFDDGCAVDVVTDVVQRLPHPPFKDAVCRYMWNTMQIRLEYAVMASAGKSVGALQKAYLLSYWSDCCEDIIDDLTYIIGRCETLTRT